MQIVYKILLTFTVSLVFSVILLITGIVLLKKRRENQSKVLPCILVGIGICGILSVLPFLSDVASTAGKEAVSISVIGGADGPTSIFLAGKVGGGNKAVNLAGFLILLLGSYIRFTKRIPFLKRYSGVKDIPLYCTIIGNGLMFEGIFIIAAQSFGADMVMLILGSVAVVFYTLIKSRKAM